MGRPIAPVALGRRVLQEIHFAADVQLDGEDAHRRAKTEANAVLTLAALSDVPVDEAGNTHLVDYTFTLKYDDGYLVRGTAAGTTVKPDFQNLNVEFYNHFSLGHLRVTGLSPQGRPAVNRPRVGDLSYGAAELQLGAMMDVKARGAFRLLRP